jgi:hypothetical protein
VRPPSLCTRRTLRCRTAERRATDADCNTGRRSSGASARASEPGRAVGLRNVQSVERAVQHAAGELGPSREQQAAGPGDGEHELTHRDAREQFVGPAQRALGHATASARRAEGPGLAREGHEPVVVAIGAREPGEASSRVAATQRLLDLARDEGGERAVSGLERRAERVPAAAHVHSNEYSFPLSTTCQYWPGRVIAR